MGLQEFKACAAHTEMLKKHGFTVETNFAGLPTSFIGKYSTGKPGPKVAFLQNMMLCLELDMVVGTTYSELQV